MKMNKAMVRLWVLSLSLTLLAGCKASGNHRAPIEERDGSEKRAAVEERDNSAKKSAISGRKFSQDANAQIYEVQKGDTLYSIAFEHGLDYRELAEKNNIENPSAIQIGQKIKLSPAEEGAGERPRIESKLLPVNIPVTVTRRDQPKVIKLVYSEQAVLQVEKMQQEPAQTTVTTVTPITTVKPGQEADAGADENLQWAIPTKGKVIADYSESANRKGLDIAGIKGQAVLASAAGKVVYSGNGLRGYGKLVIIKHNKTYLSAYAHNEQILVKEGQNVARGQKIAEMGNTDADQVKLHFEIRKFGKPVDPAKFLDFSKS
jgi:lipoprotein NlpD